MLKSIYLQQVYSDLAARDPEQKEFHQAVREVLESLDLMIDSHPEYREAALLERFVEPERVVAFRVPWMDDTGRIRVNRGYRVQFNSAIGPYKGGSYGEAAKPLRPCCARPAPHFVRSLFARAGLLRRRQHYIAHRRGKGHAAGRGGCLGVDAAHRPAVEHHIPHGRLQVKCVIVGPAVHRQANIAHGSFDFSGFNTRQQPQIKIAH